MRLVGPAPVRAEDAVTKDFVDKLLAGIGNTGGLVPTGVQTTAYTARTGDLVLCDPTAAAFTVTLPAAAAAGAVVGVKRTDTSEHPVIIAAPTGGLIDGETTMRLAGARTATRLVARTGNNWAVESTAVFDTPPVGTVAASSRATATGVLLGTQPGAQTVFTWYTIPAIAGRGMVSLIAVTADDTKGAFDVEIRGAAPAGSLWLQAVGVTGGAYRNPTCWYVENDTAGQDDLYLGIRNTGADPRTYTLAGLRVERFA